MTKMIEDQQFYYNALQNLFELFYLCTFVLLVSGRNGPWQQSDTEAVLKV